MTTPSEHELPPGTSDLLARLSTWQRVADAVTASFPHSGTGWDAADAVQVRTSRTDGVEIRAVARDWERRVGADGLAAAVLGAAAAAAADTFATADRRLGADPVWQRRGEPARPPPASAPEPRPVGSAEPVDPVALAEQVLAVTSSLRARPAAPSPARGEAAAGAVTVELGPSGLTACTVDAAWATGRSALAVSETLRTALAAAGRELAEDDTASARAAATARLGDALGQIMTVLAPRDLPPTSGVRHE